MPPHCFGDRSTESARTITALLVLRDQVIAPILAGVGSLRLGRKPATWTAPFTATPRPWASACPLFNHFAVTTKAA